MAATLPLCTLDLRPVTPEVAGTTPVGPAKVGGIHLQPTADDDDHAGGLPLTAAVRIHEFG